ncbi:MAG: adenylyltransferase/cytidyltransferase family protein [Microgenomates group bacterium]
MKKIITLSQFNQLKKNLKGKKIVLVGGCFDLFHFGHLSFLKKAKKTGDSLIIALESDEFIKKNKKREPVHNQQQRAEILSQLEIVDLIIKLPFFNKDEDYLSMVKLIKPHTIAVSENDPQIKNKLKQAKEINAQLKIVCPLIDNFSTTKILKKLKLLKL